MARRASACAFCAVLATPAHRLRLVIKSAIVAKKKRSISEISNQQLYVAENKQRLFAARIIASRCAPPPSTTRTGVHLLFSISKWAIWSVCLPDLDLQFGELGLGDGTGVTVVGGRSVGRPAGENVTRDSGVFGDLLRVWKTGANWRAAGKRRQRRQRQLSTGERRRQRNQRLFIGEKKNRHRRKGRGEKAISKQQLSAIKCGGVMRDRA